QRLVDPGMDDRFAFFQAEPRQHGIEPVGTEDPHQIVVQRQEEFRAARVTLASGSSAQLIVDAPGFVALGSDDVEAAGLLHSLGRFRAFGRFDLDGLFRFQDDIAEAFDVGLDLFGPYGLFGLIGNAGRLLLQTHFERATELDVGTAARHVGRDGDRAGYTGFG